VTPLCATPETKVASWCLKQWCYVDPCRCTLGDAAQTEFWTLGYPATSKKLAFSYLTCGNCEKRRTKDFCERSAVCKWGVIFEVIFCVHFAH
jgi:hypothetical protein